MRKTMTKLRSTRGITLIALVITIIVLLILAGVAISMLSGENGILNQAATAKTETEKKSTEEAVKLAAIDALMRGDNLTTIEDVEHLTESLTSQGLTPEKVEKNVKGKYTVEIGEKIYNVYENGVVEEKEPIIWTKTSDGALVVGSTVVTNTEEEFFVSGFTEDNLTAILLAKEGIDVDENSENYLQQSTKAGSVQFATTNYWAGTGMKDLNELNEADIAYKYAIEYGKSLGVKGRLLTKLEKSTLANNKLNIVLGIQSSKGYLDYWLGTVNGDNNVLVVIGSGGSYNSSMGYSSKNKVRPVVEVAINNIS